MEDLRVDALLAEQFPLRERHTPGDDQIRGLGVEFFGPAEHVLLRLLDHRTGVHNGDVGGLGTLDRVVAGVPERGLDPLGLPAVRGAAVRLDVVSGHPPVGRYRGCGQKRRGFVAEPLRCEGSAAPPTARRTTTPNVSGGHRVSLRVVGFWEEFVFRRLLIRNAAEGLAARSVSRTGALAGAIMLSALAFGLPHAFGAAAEYTNPAFAHYRQLFPCRTLWWHTWLREASRSRPGSILRQTRGLHESSERLTVRIQSSSRPNERWPGSIHC